MQPIGKVFKNVCVWLPKNPAVEEGDHNSIISIPFEVRRTLCEI